MRLELNIPAQIFVLQEPVPLRLRLVNDEETKKPIPYDYDAADVVTIHLYDSEGQQLDSVNGYTQDLHLGLEPSLVEQSTMSTDTMPAGATMEWVADLCSYTDIGAPGSYAVEVEFEFRPAGISVRSSRVGFEVAESHVRWIDVLVDCVATPVLHTVQQHEQEDDCRLIFHSRSVHGTCGPWFGAALTTASGCRAQIAEADFTNRDSFYHDFYRWLAWTSPKGILAATRICEQSGSSDSGWEAVYEFPLPSPDTFLLGRPFQHEDQSVSVLLGEPAGTATWKLHYRRFDTSGQQLRTQELGTLPQGTPDLVHTGSDGEGKHYLVVGDREQASVHLARIESDSMAVTAVPHFSDVREVLKIGPDWEEQEMIGLRLELKALDRPLTSSLLVALRLSSEEHQAVWIARAPLEHLDEPDAWDSRLLPLPEDLFVEEERVLAADLVSRPDGRLHILLATSTGTLLHSPVEGHLLSVAEAAAADGYQARLAVIGSDIHLFFPAEKCGLVHRVL
jgi:hypothetical protein